MPVNNPNANLGHVLTLLRAVKLSGPRDVLTFCGSQSGEIMKDATKEAGFLAVPVNTIKRTR